MFETENNEYNRDVLQGTLFTISRSGHINLNTLRRVIQFEVGIIMPTPIHINNGIYYLSHCFGSLSVFVKQGTASTDPQV